jgi:CDGSH-type Zn-finger protein/uncharacterized Fe-S cluster protein YjdI
LAPKQLRRNYTGSDLDVSYDIKRCIHAAECLRGLPVVFDRFRRPWILPDAGEAGQVAEVVRRCPSGALQYESGETEQPDVPNSITVVPNGPLYVRGQIVITDAEGQELHRDTRLSLCRCGASENKPFCDNSHIRTEFVSADPTPGAQAEEAQPGDLRITPKGNSSLKLQGGFEIHDQNGRLLGRGNAVSLCRCGASSEMPFCDDSHHDIGFVADTW